MKRTNIIYWVVTALLALQTALAGIMYFTNPEVATGFGHLGFPDYFRQELGIAKLAAAVVIILPMVPLRVREWAYAGRGIAFLSAFIAHSAVVGASTGIAGRHVGGCAGLVTPTHSGRGGVARCFLCVGSLRCYRCRPVQRSRCGCAPVRELACHPRRWLSTPRGILAG